MEGVAMADQSTNQEQPKDRQEALTIRLEEALPASALGLLENAEARYAAAVNATNAPAPVTTTTTT
jgi:hypothetical protein